MRSFAVGSQRRANLVLKIAICAAVLFLALGLGSRASAKWLIMLGVAFAAIVLLIQPTLALPAIFIAALFVPVEFNTGTAVSLNPVSLAIPALVVLWVMDRGLRGRLQIVPSAVNRPLVLFLLATLFSLLVGTVYWDPAVPRPGNFTLVQLGQVAIFAFSACAFWLTANLVADEIWLWRLTFFYLAAAGIVVILLVLPPTGPFASRITTMGLHRAPFWMLLTAVLGGQLLFNRELPSRWRVFLCATLAAVLYYAFYLQRKTASNWTGVVATIGVLAWLRFPRLRWPVLGLLAGLAVTGVLSSTVYTFAGGDTEWESSGGSRITLITRVLEVTMRNPITGLGPAAYRPYARMEPLPYGLALWIQPEVSAHNNYVDLFSHAGLIGLALFVWFAVEVARLGLSLRSRFKTGFAAGYVNSMLAVGVGALTLMLFADWILPFVYNVRFEGFQASVLVWLFLGGLVALEHMAGQRQVA